jgi:predicted hydrocarbon binding protein
MVAEPAQLKTRQRYYYPNKMGRIILLALEDVMGRNGVSAVLNLARLRHLINNYPQNNLDLQFSFEEVSGIQQALDDMYGPRGGKGLGTRAGRACFKYVLKEFGSMLGLADLAFRALPLSLKLKVGFNAFAQTLNRFSDQVVRLREDEKNFLFVIERCPACWNRQTSYPCCHLSTGLLSEAVHWVSGGKTFEVTETSCIAMGETTCTFAVTKRPLD